MACFVVPLTEAVIISAVRAVAKSSKRSAQETVKASHNDGKIDFLQKMLYGGSFLLAVEHIYHGEVSFVPPFLTAMKTPSEIPEMLHEMATVGVGMAVLTTAVWAVGVGISAIIKNKRKTAACA